MPRQERIRRERFAPINEEAQDCTHLDLYVGAQLSLAEHHTQSAINYYHQREIDDEMHRIARENGANSM